MSLRVRFVHIYIYIHTYTCTCTCTSTYTYTYAAYTYMYIDRYIHHKYYIFSCILYFWQHPMDRRRSFWLKEPWLSSTSKAWARGVSPWLSMVFFHGNMDTKTGVLVDVPTSSMRIVGVGCFFPFVCGLSAIDTAWMGRFLFMHCAQLDVLLEERELTMEWCPF